MALKDLYDLSNLENQMEQLVYDELEKQLNAVEDGAMCKCNDCILDMACLALNNLSPLYRASLIGTLYTREADEERSKAVEREVRKALKKISSNPLCGNS
ncbi:MAG: competence protein ComFB [Spirochaetales bacterium]|nr:MAG: competence protein ComFB [Spirochaetales bacterium]